MIQTLQDLFTFILRHESTLVFGNLGRKPHIVYKFLTEQFDGVDVAVVSPYYSFPTSGDHSVRLVHPENVASIQCDLLLYLEPEPYSKVFASKPANVGRIAVLASHLMFQRTASPSPTLVAYFHTLSIQDTIEKTRNLISLQDGSVQTNNVNHVRPPDSEMSVRVIDGTSDLMETFETSTYVIFDMTHFTTPFRLYLRFWDAFDVLLKNQPFVGRWMVVFPEKRGARDFEQLAQDVVDRLYCLKFEHGNVIPHENQSNLRHLLSLLPFYKSGVLDPQSFDVQTEEFCGIEYTAPDTVEELFKAGAKHNLQHWVGSVYRIL